jgi:hypothetical protein
MTGRRVGLWGFVLAVVILGLWVLWRSREPSWHGAAAARAGRAFHEFCFKESLDCDQLSGRGLGRPLDGGGYQFEFASSDRTANATILVDVLPSRVDVRPLPGSVELLKRR